MSLNSEITRIENAKQLIKTSIINKGVQVPDNVLLDMYSAYIDMIEGGGSEIDHSVLTINFNSKTFIGTEEQPLVKTYTVQKIGGPDFEGDLTLLDYFNDTDTPGETEGGEEGGEEVEGPGDDIEDPDPEPTTNITTTFTVDENGKATIYLENNYLYLFYFTGSKKYYCPNNLASAIQYVNSNSIINVVYNTLPEELSPIYVDGRRFFNYGFRVNEINDIMPKYIKGFTNMRKCFTCDSSAEIIFTPGSLDVIDTSRCENFEACFEQLNTTQGSIVDLRKWDMSNATELDYMFSNGTYNFGNVYFPENTYTKPANCQYMFQAYTSAYNHLNTIDFGWINTSATNENYYKNIFAGSTKIYTIHNFSLDYSWGSNYQGFCNSITELTWKEGHAIAQNYNNNFIFNIANITLTSPSLFVNSVGSYNGSYTRSIKFNSTTYNRLTSADIATLNSKGYTATT